MLRRGSYGEEVLKEDSDEVVLRHLKDDLERKKVRRRQPRTIRSLLGDVLARQGYAQTLDSERRDAVWRVAAGAKLASSSQAGRIRNGVLHVIVRDSVVLQELNLRRREILQTIGREAPEWKLVDLKFRIGEI